MFPLFFVFLSFYFCWLSFRFVHKVKMKFGVQYNLTKESTIEFINSRHLEDPVEFTASAWFLSEIIDPTGQKIVFSYERKGRMIIPDQYALNLSRTQTYNFKSFAHILVTFDYTRGSTEQYSTTTGSFSSYNFIYPTYLEEIKTPLQTVTFHYSSSNALSYNLNLYANPTLSQFLINYSDGEGPNSDWFKLAIKDS